MDLALLTMRTTVALAVALAAYAACRHRSAAVRHGVLAAGVFAALLVAPLGRLVPSLTVALPAAVFEAPPVMRPFVATMVGPSPRTQSAATSSEPSRRRAVPGSDDLQRTWAVPVTPGGLVTFVWLLGAAIGLMRLGTGLWGLARVSARAEAVDDPRWLMHRDAVASELGVSPPVLLVADSVGVCTWGTLRPRVLVPADAIAWSDERIRAVLGHELSHVRRRDWIVQMAAEALRAIFWFNPLPQLACRRLRDESERACDDAVLRAGVHVDAYAVHLLEIARLSRGAALAASMSMARSSTLEGRIAAMLNPNRDRGPLSIWARAITLIALVAVASGAAALRLSAQGGPAVLHGAVYDSSGGVLPGVELALVNEQGVKWTTPTDRRGQFEFAPVGSGKYVLEASIPGFRTFRQEVVLDQAKDWSRAITLQVGQLQETITVTARRPQKPAAVASGAGGAQRVRVGGNIKAPTKVFNVAPVYPESMREAALEGVVPLEVLIGTDGKVASVQVTSAQVHPAFAKAAADAVRQWIFTPTLLNGVPSEVSMTASIRFSLSD
jgi:TonB family protein